MTYKEYPYQPLILIGAGRSGTKILRDVLGSHDEIDVVPFDVNYIWTLGQPKTSHDALSSDNLTEGSRRKILSQFGKLSKGAPLLLEKTVSNTLRLPYVIKIFPDAKFIHLIRDGRDVTESVSRQWGESRELSYFFKKLKTFPVRYAFSYLMDYGLNWLRHRLGMKSKENYIWGVKYPGYDTDLATKSVLEVCATQWRVCVETSLRQFEQISQDRQLEVRYEDIMTNPTKTLARVAHFIGVDPDGFSSSRFSPRHIGKHKTALSKVELSQIMQILTPTLTKLNYI